jgi:hypothetical protein
MNETMARKAGKRIRGKGQKRLKKLLGGETFGAHILKER